MDTHKVRTRKGPARKAWEARIESGQRERLNDQWWDLIGAEASARLDLVPKFDRDGNPLPKGEPRWQTWQPADYSSRLYLTCVRVSRWYTRTEIRERFAEHGSKRWR